MAGVGAGPGSCAGGESGARGRDGGAVLWRTPGLRQIDVTTQLGRTGAVGDLIQRPLTDFQEPGELSVRAGEPLRDVPADRVDRVLDLRPSFVLS